MLARSTTRTFARHRPVKGAHIYILDVAYKRNIDDIRVSPALDVLLVLAKRGAKLSYIDPHVPVLRLDGLTLHATPQESVENADCAVIVTDQSAFNHDALVNCAKFIVDLPQCAQGPPQSKHRAPLSSPRAAFRPRAHALSY